MNPIEQIHEFNHKAGLLNDGYNDVRECAYPIEEALEGFPEANLSYIGNQLFGIEETSPKHLSRYLVTAAHSGPTGDETVYIPDVDRFDKHLDAIVFAFGSLFKLGLTPEQALRGLGVVMAHNMAKLNMPKDEAGKLMKPENFTGPEEQLQLILDERNLPWKT